jgi:hypothetical protein
MRILILLFFPLFSYSQLSIGILESSRRKLLLDQYPTTGAAFALRKVSSAYSGNCIKVRRSSDNTEQDIGFVNNVLDTASLKTFVGANNGFVTIWYDQSSGAKNAIQTTAANQPSIITSGVINYNSTNKPTLKFDGSNDALLLTAIPMSSYSFFVYYGSASGAIGEAILSDDGTSNYFMQRGGGSSFQDVPIGFTADNTFNTAGRLASTHKTFASELGIIAFNGVVQSITYFTAPYTNFQRIGQRAIGSVTLTGDITEVIFYTTNQSANRIPIETNINSFYSIY